MPQKTALLWFRQDLRRRDNPALHQALRDGYAVIPVFILDDDNAGPWRHGSASRWWLHHSLKALKGSLSGHLSLYKGDAVHLLPELVREAGAQAVYWNRCYEPWRIARDKNIKDRLSRDGIEVHSFNGALLFEPWTIKTGGGAPYRVYTPFYNKCRSAHNPGAPLPEPERITCAPPPENSLSLKALGLPPAIRRDKKLEPHWRPGEDGAWDALENFLENGLSHYKEDRDRPDRDGTSRLSPHLHWGEISPRDIWQAAGDTCETFLKELVWREFSHHLLYHFPALPEQPLQEKFAAFPWREDADSLKAWQRGRTGIPIVDAGMRQLRETGWMHNRVRMIAASLLVKNLRIHWRTGQSWFWDCLVDADLANNAASWQWVAGCGADAAPYFRIFNPVTQGERFDPDGVYVRRFVPEIAGLPDKYIHRPWEAPEKILQKANVALGKTYPAPIIDLKISREKALETYHQIK